MNTQSQSTLSYRVETRTRVSAIAFKTADTEIGQRLLNSRDRPVHAVGTLSLDRYRGREEVRFRLLDLAEAFD